MQRTNCVICLSDKLELTYSIPNYPITFIANKNSSKLNDTYINFNLISCQICGCVQLENLVNPAILYDLPHNSSGSKVWEKHNDILSDMVIEEATRSKRNVIEIGGCSGILAKIVKQKNNLVSYTIFDICNNNPNIKNIDFILGNCEEYDFPSDSIIVLSHVFEHLYEPHKFVKNMKKNNIKDIFISIPNMTAQIKHNIHPVLYQEHTYLCELNDIKYIFSYYGYSIKSQYNYDIHAILLHFTISDIPLEDIIKPNFDRITYIKKMYTEKYIKTKNLVLEKPFYIIPASFSGLQIYNNINDKYKENILGFLDNDKNKVGKRFYGTDTFIFNMEHIKSYDNEIIIVIHQGAYINEIMNQLNSYKNNIKFIII
jgi:hypothetical protein